MVDIFQQAIERSRKFLLTAQSPQGGWPYTTGRAYVEPTAYAALALGSSPESTRALAFLAKAGQSGVVRFNEAEPNDEFPPVDTWGTILSLFTFNHLQSHAALAAKFRQYLLNTRGNNLEDGESGRLKLQGRVQGWLWSVNTTSWVEPTSYAVLTLKQAGLAAHPRVLEAENYLRDRACYSGGWNYGNKEVLGVKLEPWPTITAYALMALAGHCPPQLRDRSLDWLQTDVAARQSTLSLALAIHCFNLAGRPFTPLATALLTRQNSDGSWRGNPHLTGLACLALQVASGGPNIFEVPST